MEPIRMVTWLSPGIPLALFDKVRDTLEQSLSIPTTLEARTKLSGPAIGSPDPFLDNRAEVGFLCAPAAVPETVRNRGGFQLLELAPVFDDVRYQQHPHCFCDIVIAAQTNGSKLTDLKGLTFGYNDRSSLSGWLGLNAALHKAQTQPDSFFGKLVHTGGHLQSLESLRDGSIQVASIDSNVLRSHPDSMRGLRIVHSIGPLPSQPVVVRNTLPPAIKDRIKQALGTCGPWPEWGFIRFGDQPSDALLQVPSAQVHG